jgi:hypothetical protein
MQFLKKNYEKILLGLVLLGFVVAVVFLLWYVGKEKEAQDNRRDSIVNRAVKPLEPPVLTGADLLFQRAAVPVMLDLSTTNRLFNPLRWQKPINGPPFPTGEFGGLKTLQITKSTPLYFTISLDSVTLADAGARYAIGVDQQAGAKPKGKRQFFASVGEKKEPFILREAKGPPDNPTALVLELTDTGEQISITKDKPFRRVDGYMVDMKYPPENRNFPNRRIDSTIFFGGNEYKVLGITQDEVVLSAPNQKHWTIKFSAAP